MYCVRSVHLPPGRRSCRVGLATHADHKRTVVRAAFARGPAFVQALPGPWPISPIHAACIGARSSPVISLHDAPASYVCASRKVLVMCGLLRVWSQVGLSSQLLYASTINSKQPASTAQRHAPITPHPAIRMRSAHAFDCVIYICVPRFLCPSTGDDARVGI